MAEVLNRVKTLVVGAPGNGATVTLGAAEPGMQTWSQAGAKDGVSYNYVIEDSQFFEVGVGKFDAANNQISRDTVYDSSAGYGVRETFTSEARVYSAQLESDLSEIGDIRYSHRLSLPGHVLADGSSYLSSLYPEAAKIFPETAGTLVMTPVQRGKVFSFLKLRAVCAHTSNWAGVGDNGLAMYFDTSSNNVTAYSYIGVNVSFNGIAYGAPSGVGARFVAVGDGGNIRYTADVLDSAWTAATSPVTTRLNAVIYHTGTSTWFAVGDGGVLIKSANGAVWTTVSTGTTDDLRAIAFYGTNLVACGANGRIIFSADSGATWATGVASSAPTASLRACAINTSNIPYYAGDNNVLLQATSMAAATTTTTRNPAGTPGNFLSGNSASTQVHFGRDNGTIVYGSNAAFSESLVGTPTTKVNAIFFRDSQNALAGTDEGFAIYFSSWAFQRAYYPGSPPSYSAANATGVVTLLDRKTLVFSPSSDITSRRVVYRPNAASKYITKVIAVGSAFVAIGYNSSGGPGAFFATSPDGENWTERSSVYSYNPGTGESLTCAAYANGKLVLGGRSKILYTTDLENFSTWTQVTLSDVIVVDSIVYAEHIKQWVALCSDNPTGNKTIIFDNSFTRLNSAIVDTLYNLISANGIIVAIGSTAVRWSIDGLKWNVGTGTITNAGNGAALSYINGNFIYASSYLAKSTDGKTWQQYSMSTPGFGNYVVTALSSFGNNVYFFTDDRGNGELYQYYYASTPATPKQFRVPTISALADRLYPHVRVQ